MYYLSKKWFILFVLGTIGTVAISSYLCGYEIGSERAHDVHDSVKKYAILLEKENSLLNQELERKEQCQNLEEN